MPIQNISKGTHANDGTGTPLRLAADIINNNFAYVVSLFSGYVSSAALSAFNYVTSSNLAITLAGYVTNSALSSALSEKLDASAYNDRFKGKFTTIELLTSAHPTANDGDYAIVDAGTGNDSLEYLWDLNDAHWVESGSVSLSTTDTLTEGSINLYFTAARAISALASTLTSYAQLTVAQSFTKAQRVTPIALTSSSNIDIDLLLSNEFTLTPISSFTLINPTNIANQIGQHFTIAINLTNAGCLMSLGSYWKSTDGTVPELSTTVGAVNVMACHVDTATQISFNLIKHGVA